MAHFEVDGFLEHRGGVGLLGGLGAGCLGGRVQLDRQELDIGREQRGTSARTSSEPHQVHAAPAYEAYAPGDKNSSPVSIRPTSPTCIWFAALPAKPANQLPWNDSVLSAPVAASSVAVANPPRRSRPPGSGRCRPPAADRRRPFASRPGGRRSPHPTAAPAAGGCSRRI